MSKYNNYCIICGNELDDDVNTYYCSKRCGRKLTEFKSNEKTISTVGFCNYCGKPLVINKKNHNTKEKIRINRLHEECPGSSAGVVDPNNSKVARANICNNPDVKNNDDQSDDSHISGRNYKLFDEDTMLFLCPECGTYSVDRKKYSHDNELRRDSVVYRCSLCNKTVQISKVTEVFTPNITPEDKYKIYKTYDINTLAEVLGRSINDMKWFIRNYFEQKCSSMGDNCIYNNHIKDVRSFNLITSRMKYEKGRCKSIKSKHERYSLLIHYMKQLIKYQTSKIDMFYEDLNFINESVDSVMEDLDQYVRATATTGIKTGQQLVLKIENDELMAYPDSDGEDYCFAWSDANKDEFVAVCGYPPKILDKIEDVFDNLDKNIENYLHNTCNTIVSIPGLSNADKQALDLIIDNKGIRQNELWKTMNIDSRSCSRIVQKLVRFGLVFRKKCTVRGSNTYSLYPEKYINLKAVILHYIAKEEAVYEKFVHRNLKINKESAIHNVELLEDKGMISRKTIKSGGFVRRMLYIT